jgi:hypothetical protein
MNISERRLQAYEDLFVHRKDLHARQRPDGSYALRLAPATREVVGAHLAGAITAGWYALDCASTAKWAVLDADSDDGITRLQQSFLALDGLGIPSYLERSRRGGHLWIFLAQPLPASGVRQLVQAAVPDLGGLELYPKQDSLHGKRVGSLVRAPLGVHRRADARYPFIDPISLRPLARTVLTTIDALLEVERLSPQRAAEILTALRQAPEAAVAARATAPLSDGTASRPASLIDQVKQRIGDPYIFIGRYLDLDPSGKAHCPFHPPDRHKSFAINRQTGKWTDFHEFHPDSRTYAGGDALDFYARYRHISLKEAIRELL